MKRKRFSTEQIVAAMKQHELGTPAAEIIRKLGIAEQTFYRWKRQYGGLEAEQAREPTSSKKGGKAVPTPRHGPVSAGQL